MKLKICAAKVKQYFLHHHREVPWTITDKEFELFLMRNCVCECKDMAQIAILLMDYILSDNEDDD